MPMWAYTLPLQHGIRTYHWSSQLEMLIIWLGPDSANKSQAWLWSNPNSTCFCFLQWAFLDLNLKEKKNLHRCFFTLLFPLPILCGLFLLFFLFCMCVCLCLKSVCLWKVGALLRQDLSSVFHSAPHMKCICSHSPSPALSRARKTTSGQQPPVQQWRQGFCRHGKSKKLTSKLLSTKVLSAVWLP